MNASSILTKPSGSLETQALALLFVFSPISKIVIFMKLMALAFLSSPKNQKKEATLAPTTKRSGLLSEMIQDA